MKGHIMALRNRLFNILLIPEENIFGYFQSLEDHFT